MALIPEAQLQTILQELHVIRASSERITGKNSTRAKTLFRKLKKSYTNDEIYGLTKGEWAFSTIKRYTKGVETQESTNSSDDESTERAVPIALAAEGFSADQVKKARDLLQTLAQHGVSTEEVLSVIQAAIASTLPVRTLVSTIKDLKDSSISINEMCSILELRMELEQIGVTTKSLKQLVQAVTKYGSTEKVIDALLATSDLQNIQAQVSKAKSENDELARVRQELVSTIDALESRRQSSEATLAKLQKLESRGFSQTVFEDLITISDTLGGAGPAKMIDALKNYVANLELAVEQRKMQDELALIQTQIQKRKADYGYLSEFMSMCDRLQALDFSPAAMERIYMAARAFGDPSEILMAISEFGRQMKGNVDLEELKDFPKIRQEREDVVARNKELEDRLRDSEQIKRERDELAKASKDRIATAVQLVDEVVDQLDKPNPEHRTYRKELADSGLSSRIEEAIEKIASKRLVASQDRELVSLFQSETTSMMEKWLALWPTSKLGTMNPEKTARLKEAANQHPFVALKKKWRVPCDTCRLWHYLNLDTTFEIEKILRKGKVITYPDSLLTSVYGPHTKDVSLQELVEMYLIEMTRDPKR
jgi:hypothetical protein